MVHSSEVVFRDGALAADIAPLERILRESRFFRADEVVVALELLCDGAAKGDDSEYKFVIAERDGRVVGYACYGRIACTLHSYDLYWIAVEPALQRTGIGRKLMAAAEERIHAQGGRRVYAETSGRPLYEPTRRFYGRCAYRVEATLPDFYAPGDDKLVFVKVLA